MAVQWHKCLDCGAPAGTPCADNCASWDAALAEELADFDAIPRVCCADPGCPCRFEAAS